MSNKRNKDLYMKPLRTPMSGVGFWLWRFYFHFNLARDFVWSEDHEAKRRTYIFELSLVEFDGLAAISITALPIKIMVGANFK